MYFVPVNSLLNNIERNKYNRCLLPKINWGRGRLSRYESFTGVSAKFCRLNNLTAKQCREFFTELFKSFPVSENQLIIKHIAHVLDEPITIVKTVFWNNDLGWKYLSIQQKNYYLDHEIAYCPLCLADGYHGYFHEYPWLKKCPIHCIDIEKESFSLGETKFDQFVNRLSSLFDQYCPEWEVSEGKYLCKNAIKKIPSFDKFIKWHSTVQSDLAPI
jgi:hypothetical protein